MKETLTKLKQQVAQFEDGCAYNQNDVQAVLNTIKEMDTILERIDDSDSGDIPQWLIELLN